MVYADDLSLLDTRMKKTKKQRGFTLAELVIVVSVILILSIIAFVSYRQSQYRSDVRNGAERLASDLRHAQELSRGGIVQDQSHGADSRYGVAITSPATYLVYRDVNGNIFYDAGTDDVISQETLPSRVTMVLPNKVTYSISFPVAGDSSDTFVFESGVKLNSTPFEVTFISERVHDIKRVEVKSSGVITVL
ncbi:prepilin-type N-terminal cleavage/methylation domain-containing protein [Patescibacteria group bacterium]|nr:prepilin-type N-terminal cleavage/methylation domain-containing protein [Patescibacteria group bacterium]